jgi:cytochrome c oxidase subunit II
MMLALSDITREVDRAFLLIGVASLILLAGITIAMIVFAVRFRRGAARTTTQIRGHIWLEITWIVIPTIIVTWMFFVGFKGFFLMRNVPDGAMVVEVTGQQWMWSFHYPEEKLDTVEMVVPVNTPVKVELTSPPGDVVHSFYIPDFRVKEDAVPGMETFLWFEAEREGTYNIFCAEFCGKDHSQMLSLLKVVSQGDYEKWVRAEHARKYKPLVFEAVVDPQHEEFGPDGLNIDSQAMYKTFCQSCHGAAGDGSGLPGVARDFTKPTDWKRSGKVADIFRTLTEGIDGTQMRAYPNLSPWERVALAHRVRAFMQEKMPPDTEEEYAALVKEYELDKVKAPGETIPIERAIEILGNEEKTVKGIEN